MKFYKRAFYYVTRKKGKTVLLLLILVVAASMLLGGFSFLQSVKGQQQAIGEKSQTKLSVEPGAKNTAITLEQTEDMQALENVAWLNRISSAFATPVGFEPAPGSETPHEPTARLYGYDDTEADGSFAAQLLRLQSGRHLKSGDTHGVLLHHSLAKANGLALGDTIAFVGSGGKPVTATVQGIYQSLSGDDGNGQVPTAQRPENQIYATQDILEALQAKPAYEQVVVYVKNPEQLAATQQALKTVVDDCQISAHDALFRRMQATLAQTQKSAVLVIVLTAVTASVCVTLLLCMWSRDRLREFAVLLSLGVPVWELYLQLYTELALLYGAALVLALPASGACMPLLGRLLSAGESSAGLELRLAVSGIFPLIATGLVVLAVAGFLALLPLHSTNIKGLLTRAD